MKLTPAQTLNPLWQTLRSHYVMRLAQLRSENDSTTLSEKDTAVLRGRIAECKAFLDMDSPDPEVIQVQGM